MADTSFFEDLYEFDEKEIRDIRILFAIDPPEANGPVRFLEYIADNELLILKKVLITMNETRYKIKIKEQRKVTSYVVCARCGKPFKRTVRSKG